MKEGYEVGKVQCDLCSFRWVAQMPSGLKKIECPNCENMAYFEFIDV